MGRQTAAGGAACPVCRLPGLQETGPCKSCGWDQQAASLLRWQRDYDLRAAARVAGVAGARDDAMLAWLAGLARGEPAQARHIDQAGRWADQEDGMPTSLGAGIGFSLSRLVAGKTEAIAFFEIGRDAVSMRTLAVNEQGGLVSKVDDSLPWSSLVPALPSDNGLRYLRMAGGVGVNRQAQSPARDLGKAGDRIDAGGQAGGEEAAPAVLIAAMRHALGPALGRLTAAAGISPGATHRIDNVLVRRTYRWPLLDDATTRARPLLRPVAEIVALDNRALVEIVDDVAARAPLRYPYGLVLAQAGAPVGDLVPVTCELFPAGASGSPDAPVRARPIKLAAPDGRLTDQVVLPVIERRGPIRDFRDLAAVADRWPLVTMGSLAAPGMPFKLHARLLGRGMVDLAAEPGELAAADQMADWPELLRAPSSPEMVDLVLLVELGDPSARVIADRVALANALVAQFRGDPEAKIAVLGYRDHFGKHRVDAIGAGHEEDALIVGCGLSTTAGAAFTLSRPELWHQVPVNDDHAAPVECALQPLRHKEFGWRPGARHVVFIIGRRPPHPRWAGLGGDVTLPCPHESSWEHSLGWLVMRHAVECFAVLDRRPATAAAGRWWDVARQGVTWRGNPRATPQQLKRVAVGSPVPSARRHLAVPYGAASAAQPGQEARP